MALTSLLWTGCSQAPPPAAKKGSDRPPEPVTGQSALYKMYQKARSWAPDVQVLTLNSIPVQDVPSAPGKAGAWQAQFTSASLGKMQTFTYSVVEQEGNLHQGVFSSGIQGWSGSAGVNTPFDIRELRADSDAAFKTADEHATDYDQKHPGVPISFLLEKVKDFTTPAWRVIWGESVGTSGFSIYVDAVQGKFLEKMH
ncbi:MAG TPA: hypothetical protein VHW09_20320 [Bryobacteraceae bacterium]|jgi:hypothetical protein|nr:hypothetical protein [Bryobacteraceae bacterium]